MTHFSEQLAWQNYFAVQVAAAEIEEGEAESRLKLEETEAQLLSDKAKVTDQRLDRDRNPRVRAARDKYMVARATRKLLTVTMENRERCVNIISRELTRRTGGTNKRSNYLP